MKVLSWNIQGGKKLHAIAELLYLKNKFRPDMVFIIETRTNHCNSRRILKSLHFDHTLIIDPINHCGGIWVAWSSTNIIVENLTSTQRCAHLDILYRPTNLRYSITGVYGPAQAIDKDDFWQYLNDYFRALSKPWLLVGDFNEMLSLSDKQGGRPLSPSQLYRLSNFLSLSNGLDIPCLQTAFSWKNTQHSTTIYERLDRALAHSSFLTDFPHTSTRYGNFTASDHAPLFVDTNDLAPSRPFHFRFQNHWTLEPESHRIVRSAWQTPIRGSRFHRIQLKLRHIKTSLKSWAFLKYKHNNNKLVENETKIKALQEQLWQQPYNTIWIKHINRLITQREKILLYGQHLWGSQSRKQWLTQGDRNSRFFHNRMRKKTATTTIYRLQNELGQWVDSQDDISQLLTHAFRTRFASPFSTPRSLDLSFVHTIVIPQDTSLLLAPVTQEEIKAAFFDINPHRAPGSDGFGSKFFHAYWPIVQKDICLAIQSFFSHGKLPPSLNHTLITLLPKRDDPSSPNHFRPISLINTIYKAISKILVSRLSPILQRELSPFQNAFTKDRSIHDNLLLVQEILNSFHKSKNRTGWCALKLDMEKAYDRIEWDFLWQCLHAMGFPAQWIEWIRECVSNVSYSIKINGHTTPWFRPSRGLRQGDPLSPYLFILCMESFVMKLSQSASSPGSGIGFKIQPNTPIILCLLFADDCLLLCKATSSACHKLKSHIDDFCTLSGQLVNFHKSAIIFSKQITSQ